MVRIIYISLLLVLVSACKKNKYEIENINGNQIDVLGHAGMGIKNLYPINSMESLTAALNSTGDGTEMDIQLTSDSVIMIFHDSDLKFSTNKSGILNNYTRSELLGTKYNSADYGNYDLVELNDFMESIVDFTSRKFTFDVKLYTQETNKVAYYNRFARKIRDIYLSFNLYDHVLVESNNITFLNSLKNLDSNIRSLYLPEDFQSGYNTAIANQFYGITISTNDITKDEIKLAHDAGLFVAIWNVHNKKMNAEAIEKNPDMIQSDRLDHLCKLLNK